VVDIGWKKLRAEVGNEYQAASPVKKNIFLKIGFNRLG
jgi:hypothetical protein